MPPVKYSITLQKINTLTWLRSIKYIPEGFLLLLALLILRMLPLDFASYIMGKIARFIGPYLKVHKTAYNNLKLAMPELSEDDCTVILNDMWDNLGRVIGEYPHFARPEMSRRITIKGLENLEGFLKSGKAAVFVSGHFANWEMVPLATSLFGLPTAIIYRQLNNPVAEWICCKIRKNYTKGMFKKGRMGAVQSIKTLNEGNALAMLIDQKLNDGSPVQFFGRPAMTATAAARLAIKFQAPILAGRIVRGMGVNFTLIIDSPVDYTPDADAIEITTKLNQMLERWIREYPSQWFWVHKRWGKVREL